MRILVTAGYYLPGWKGGGAVRSVSNLVEMLGSDFDFRIVTRDRDFGDTTPYAGIRQDQWQKVGRAEVLYLSPANQTLGSFRRILQGTQFEILYLTSFFSPIFTTVPLLLRRLGVTRKTPVLLAPLGEFSRGALGVNSVKKRTFLAFARCLGLHQDLFWHASTPDERSDINRVVRTNATTFCVTDLASPHQSTGRFVGARREHVGRVNGPLRAIFVSRIAPVKNLHGALHMLKKVRGQLQLDIFGPLEDMAYWRECEKLAASMPSGISVKYSGELAPEQVIPTIACYDVFLFPTLGENFGHVIVEALLAGCPVLISDQTPWRNLRQQRVGWDLPLNRPDMFVEAIHESMKLDSAEREARSKLAHEYGMRIVEAGNKRSVEGYRDMFQQVSGTFHV